jgi:hypothetical protein
MMIFLIGAAAINPLYREVSLKKTGVAAPGRRRPGRMT